MKTGEEGEGWVELKERLMMREGGREGCRVGAAKEGTLGRPRQREGWRTG